MRLELEPGAPVSEAQLVARFGFSKAAVRAALARLRAERLVLAEPRRGHVIAPLTIRDVGEIYDLRLLLEPPAAAAAAGRIAPDELAHLRARSEPALDLDDPASVDRFMEANRAVHVSVAAASGNRRAALIVARLLDDSERARLVALRAGAGGRGLRARDEHRALLARARGRRRRRGRTADGRRHPRLPRRVARRAARRRRRRAAVVSAMHVSGPGGLLWAPEPLHRVVLQFLDPCPGRRC